MQLKYGVVLAGNQYTNAILKAMQLAWPEGMEQVVTAGRDGKHGPKSYHYQDRAIDARSRDMTQEQKQRVLAKLRELLPAYYDVVLEDDHFHIEADAEKEKQCLASSSPKST